MEHCCQKEKKELVSVLVPVYNVEQFLRTCVESILCQTYPKLEIILVDDGSTDSSPTICDQLAMSDLRVKVFHQSNHGICYTREFALSQAQGDFIAWVDSDDRIEPDMIELMMKSAREHNADVVGCNLDIVWADRKQEVRTYYQTKEDFLRDTIANQWASLVKILIKKSLINDKNIHFPQGINNGEDYYFVNLCLLHAEKISCVDKTLYHYVRLNPNSTIATPSIQKTMEQITSTKLVEEKLKELNLLRRYRKELLFRKFVAKEPLYHTNFWKWLFVFPESSHIMLRTRLGALKHKITGQ